MIDKARLLEKGAAYGLDLAPIADQLALYATLLVDYNQRVNLTAITQPADIETKHFIDSLLLAARPQVAGRVVDVGTGAGFPGVVMKLYKPQLELFLMEPTGKRLDFLRTLCSALGLEAVFIKERGEEAARKQWREAFDVATARAVANLPALCEYCLPLVKVGGWFLPMKGALDETGAAGRAAGLLGGQLEETWHYHLPDGEARQIIAYRKIAPTPAAYPRNGGKIAKKPL